MNFHHMRQLADDRAQALRAEADRQRLARQASEPRRRAADRSLARRLERGLQRGLGLGRAHA